MMALRYANKLNNVKEFQDVDDDWDFYVYLDTDDEHEKSSYNKNDKMDSFYYNYLITSNYDSCNDDDDDDDDDNYDDPTAGKINKRNLYLLTGCLFTGFLFTFAIASHFSRNVQTKDSTILGVLISNLR